MKQEHLKWLVVGSIGAYLFYKVRKGEKENQLLGFKTADSDTIMDSVTPWLKVNPTIEPFVKSFGKSFLNRVLEDPKKEREVIDVEYRNL